MTKNIRLAPSPKEDFRAPSLVANILNFVFPIALAVCGVLIGYYYFM